METNRPSRLEDHHGYWLRCLSNLVHEGFAARVQAHDVSVAQWVVLRCLFDVEDTSLHELARTVGVDGGALSRMVERLVRKGLIVRETDPGDRRAVRLRLTETGRALVPVLASAADENDRAFFGVLPEREREGLRKAVEILLERNGWRADERGKALD
jgi:DNA-binding MarR family transcriptional regulator